MRILIALDESSVSARAAQVAAQVFSAQPDVEFLVINVARIPTPWVGAMGFGLVAPMVVDPEWLDRDVDDEERELVADARAAGLSDAKPIVRAGDPVEQICAAADEHAVDLIVVGSHDKSALRRLVDPSTASGVVRGTHLPVLVVSGAPPAS